MDRQKKYMQATPNFFGDFIISNERAGMVEITEIIKIIHEYS